MPTAVIVPTAPNIGRAVTVATPIAAPFVIFTNPLMNPICAPQASPKIVCHLVATAVLFRVAILLVLGSLVLVGLILVALASPFLLPLLLPLFFVLALVAWITLFVMCNYFVANLVSNLPHCLLWCNPSLIPLMYLWPSKYDDDDHNHQPN